MNRRQLLWLLPLALAAAGAQAAGLKVEGAWARSTPPGARFGAAYLTIDNRGGRADRLLTVKTAAADSVEVHQSYIEAEVAKMRKISILHVGANEVVTFEPGGLHFMLIGLKKPLVAGKTFTLELGFEVSGTKRATVKVRDI